MSGNDGFEEVGNADAWSPENVGDSITGVYLGTQHDVGPNNSQMHNIRTADGDKGVWGSTVLDGRFKQVTVNDIVRVTYLGLSTKSSPGKKPFKLWKLESKPGDGSYGQGDAPAETETKEAPVQDAVLDADGNIDVSKLDY